MQPSSHADINPATEPLSLDAVARALVDAYRERKLIEAPSRTLRPFAKDHALEIGEIVRRLRIGQGDTPVGYKVGFTNGAVRTQFEAEAPLAATVYRETLSSTHRVDAGSLLGPRIEPEIVIGIGAAREPVWAALGFEIVQSHVADWNFGYLDAIADFGLHAALIVGQPRPMTRSEIERLGHVRVRLLRNGVVAEHGAARDVDGGPLGSLTWLRSELQRLHRELQAGEIVSTGSMTRVPAIEPGERWTVEATEDELPALTIDID
jgi:2-oxo-3-hexenedioate decarboxylase